MVMLVRCISDLPMFPLLLLVVLSMLLAQVVAPGLLPGLRSGQMAHSPKEQRLQDKVLKYSFVWSPHSSLTSYP
jgi:hypothetical protein